MLHEGIGIERGSITTLHDMTNTQTIVDAPHKDLRRARAARLSLIPTTTGSATAIGLIFPELAGQARRARGARAAAERLAHRLRLRGRARRPPSTRSTACCRDAAEGPLKGILGYEERPLVSVDFKDDPRSAIVDAPSTMVDRRHAGEGPGLVRQRVGLREPAGRAGRDGRRRRCRRHEHEAPRPRPKVDLRNYALVTGAYWADTIADGATRMLVLFYFYDLGYSPFEVASLFLFYEIFGIVTNLVGGWLAARLGLRTTLLMGLGTQSSPSSMLAFAPELVARRAAT